MHMNTLTIQMNPVNKSFDCSCFVFGFCFFFVRFMFLVDVAY